MIAIIGFKDELVITREEAAKIKINFHECNRIGLKESKLVAMGSGDYYRDELEEKEGKYYRKEKEINSWYLRERPLIVQDWVVVKEIDNHLVDLEWFALNCPYTFYILKTVRSCEPTTQNIQTLMLTIEEKMKSVDKTVDIMQNQLFNQKVDVHIGGGFLATYNELCLKEDCCTDALQQELNDGWRMIAVCVQPNQRRPDYILGRYNHDLHVYENDNAKR